MMNMTLHALHCIKINNMRQSILNLTVQFFLPKKDASDDPLTCKEYDVHPRVDGVNRGSERVVIGSDGKAYYSNNHYQTFKEIKLK